MRTQYAWQAIKLYTEVGNKEYNSILKAISSWNRVDMLADMIIKIDLILITVLEVKNKRNARKKWEYSEYLRNKFLKSLRI